MPGSSIEEPFDHGDRPLPDTVQQSVFPHGVLRIVLPERRSCRIEGEPEGALPLIQFVEVTADGGTGTGQRLEILQIAAQERSPVGFRRPRCQDPSLPFLRSSIPGEGRPRT